MKVLHVDVSAICDKFYLTFFSHLKESGVEQKVYCPYSKSENDNEDVRKTMENYQTRDLM